MIRIELQLFLETLILYSIGTILDYLAVIFMIKVGAVRNGSDWKGLWDQIARAEDTAAWVRE